MTQSVLFDDNASFSSRSTRKSALDTGKVKRPKVKKIEPLLTQHTLFLSICAEITETAKDIANRCRMITPEPNKTVASAMTYNANRTIFESILQQMMEEILQDPSLVPEDVKERPPPYFAQMVQLPSHPVSQTSIAPESRTLQSPDFQFVMNSVLEETILNLVKEAAFGDFDLLTKPTLVHQPSNNNELYKVRSSKPSRQVRFE